MMRRHSDATDGLPGASDRAVARWYGSGSAQREWAAAAAALAALMLIAAATGHLVRQAADRAGQTATNGLADDLAGARGATLADDLAGARGATLADDLAGARGAMPADDLAGARGTLPDARGTTPDTGASLAGSGSSEWAHVISSRDDADPLAIPLPDSGRWLAPDHLVRLRVPVLTYHVIAPPGVAVAYSAADLAISPERFEDHLRLLRDAGWRTITAEGLAQSLATGRVPPARTVVITIDDGFADGFVYALPILQRYSFIATFYVVAGRMGEPNHLSWDQARSLARAGMEIGNHTQDHRALTQLPAAEAARQIGDAQAAIERAIGQAPTTLAYPFGDVNEMVAASAEAAGLSLAFTTRGGATETWATRFILPRIHVGAGLSAASLQLVLDELR